MAALAFLLVFYLNLHACTARLLMFSDKKFAAHLHFLNKDHKALNMVELDNLKFYFEKKGKKIKSSHSWKILHQATGVEISRRAGRSMLESSVSKTEERVSSKDNETGTVEDIVVMDYAQPHRKPPIHNKGT